MALVWSLVQVVRPPRKDLLRMKAKDCLSLEEPTRILVALVCSSPQGKDPVRLTLCQALVLTLVAEETGRGDAKRMRTEDIGLVQLLPTMGIIATVGGESTGLPMATPPDFALAVQPKLAVEAEDFRRISLRGRRMGKEAVEAKPIQNQRLMIALGSPGGVAHF